MAKPVHRLIALCDGTWNGVSTGTNINKLKKYITNTTDQRVGYFQGVGLGSKVEGSKSTVLSAAIDFFKHIPQFLFNGAFADDIKRKIMDVYEWLIDNYNEDADNEIWLFGFSRGAYTARCVAGLIRNCGLLKKHNKRFLEEAYRRYRSREDQYKLDSEESKTFRQSVSHNVRIRFMGLFDTVGSLGIPVHVTGTGLEYLQFFDDKLPNIVDYAYQALAAHSRSDFFRPAHIRKNPTNQHTVIEERWFPGVHYDIGGFGFGIGDERLSNASLWWIITKIQEREKADNITVINYNMLNDTLIRSISTNEGVDDPSWIRWIKSRLPIPLIGDPHPDIRIYNSSLNDRIIDSIDNQITCLYNDGDWSHLRSKEHLEKHYESKAYENFITRVLAHHPGGNLPKPFLNYLNGAPRANHI